MNMKAALTPRIQPCVWTRCGRRTESDTDSQQTHRPFQRRLDEIRSKCHHGPERTDRNRHHSGEQLKTTLQQPHKQPEQYSQ